MKAFFNRVMKFIKENVVVIGLLVLYLCFISFWEDKVWRWLIDPVLSKFDCNWITTIVFLLLAAFLLVGYVRLVKREYIITDRIVGLALVSGGLWAWYRFTTDWAYPMYGLPRLSYVDIIVVAAVGCICVWLYQQFCCKPRKSNVEQVEGFTIDAPIDSRDEDLLGRKDRAENIAQKMMSTDVEKAAFTLGIVARWGEGKSSFMRMMKEYLKERYGCDLIVMDFNPWLYGKDVNLTHVFFDELLHTLSPLNWRLARRLRHYANTLVGTNTLFDKVATYSLMLFSDKNVTEQYEDLKKQVRQLEKKIVVFVDDVDRLESTEMMEVFHLVRNASNFPNMYFVMGYDKTYVIENLRDSLGVHCLSYTDKILQEEYMLPLIVNDQIKKRLSKIIKKLKPLDEDMIPFWLDSNALSGIDWEQYIKNLRDVKRFSNILSADYMKLKDEVNMRDFVLFELLRWRYPIIHSLIEDWWEKLFLHIEGRIVLFREEMRAEIAKQESMTRPKIRIDLVEYMKKEKENLHLKTKDILQIETMLKALWGRSKTVNKFNINHPQYIARYFYNSLLEKDIPEREMQALLCMPFEEMKPTLRLWLERKEHFLISYLERIPKDKEEIKLRLRMIFYVNSITRMWGVGDGTIDAMLYQLRDVSAGDGYSSDIKKFLKNALLENGEQSYVLKYLAEKEKNRVSLGLFPLNLEEVRQVKVEVFRKYVDAHKDDIRAVFSVWYQTRTGLKEAITSDVPGAVWIGEYNRLMRERACQCFERFIPLTIQRDSAHYQYYKLIELWPDLWGDYWAYDAYVEAREHIDIAIASEYRRFMREYRTQKSEYMQFEFKDIQV